MWKYYLTAIMHLELVQNNFLHNFRLSFENPAKDVYVNVKIVHTCVAHRP